MRSDQLLGGATCESTMPEQKTVAKTVKEIADEMDAEAAKSGTHGLSEAERDELLGLRQSSQRNAADIALERRAGS